jgi:hypothetical protein
MDTMGGVGAGVVTVLVELGGAMEVAGEAFVAAWVRGQSGRLAGQGCGRGCGGDERVA